MVAVLKQGTSEKQIENLTNWLHSQGVDTHISYGKDHIIIGLVGDTTKIDEELLSSLEISFSDMPIFSSSAESAR